MYCKLENFRKLAYLVENAQAREHYRHRSIIHNICRCIIEIGRYYVGMRLASVFLSPPSQHTVTNCLRQAACDAVAHGELEAAASQVKP